MNWFKKQINKILNKDEYEYEYEEFYEDYGEEQAEQLHTQQDAPMTKQKTFRFPLIDDDEEGVVSQAPPKEMFNQVENDDYYGQIEDLSLPKHLNHHIVDSSVYDVDVSGIRDLLASRSKRTGRKTTVKSQPVEQEHRSRASLVFRDAQDREESIIPKTTSAPKDKPQWQEQKAQKVDSDFLENRKRFIPTDVPSPVYGFAKPSPINELLDKRKEEHELQETARTTSDVWTIHQPLKEATTNEANENILEEKEPPSTGHHVEIEQEFHEPTVKPITFDADVLDEEKGVPDSAPTDIVVPPTTPFARAFEDQVKEAAMQDQTLQQLSADQSEIHVKELIVEQVQIENSTIHIGEVTVVQPSSNEEDYQMGMDEQSSDAMPKEEKSRIPFNVLMLKTDKEKWRIQQQIKMAQPIRVESNPEAVEDVLMDVTEAKEVEQSLPSVSIDTDAIQLVEPQLEEESDSQSALFSQIQGDVEYNRHENERQDLITEAQSENPVEVITMAPVTTMTRVSSNEEAEIARISADEVAATTELESEIISETEVYPEIVEDSPVKPVENLEQVLEAEQELAVEEKAIPVHVYQKPTDEYLELPEEKTQDTDWMEQQGDTLVEALSYFQVSAQIESIMQGPAVTQFEITVSHGTKVSKIRNLADDLKLALAAKDIRIQAPIPGKSSIGIEIPNRVSRAVRLSEVTNSASFLESDSPLEAALGLDLTGKPVTLDLRKMPHGLIAGATGSGKSVCINSILVSLLYKAAPHELKLMLIDPKMVELAPFNHIPHLVSPVITDVKAATAALKWAVEEMERRYQLFAHAGARDITRYNAIADKNNEHSLKLPYILIVIDELADLMMMSPADVEEAICRIAQKARACGIHLIVATQRPSVDVITGLIKSNIPTRIAFAVSSQIDSRTILDGQGAERLLGRGDMLYLGNGMSAPVRLQGTFVTDDEIEAIIEHVREQGEPDYIFDQEELLKKTEVSAEQDDLFEDVCRFVFEQGGASTSLIQRKYHIGYNRAARLIDMLESHGFISEARGSKPRESFITEEDLITMFE
ncbi:DNA translocase FtsK [Lysinibacillus fusiformis]|uniref:DNA translocase FtsK n=1 Tax=Lysinibacillus fusiformis TaxID=28031 RepID=UPI00088C2D96|nr:DNA translocase FtsK [Lysinibacillus fusiformis]SCX53248.1 DNA translocase FtsK [Lysinibacillus fusiformis]SDB26357.1 DNA translocase FtsK [Lysinibacillus fusiformis]SFI18624.1 DNA translocase FtsK [Lysinibacillus fusiformis]SFS77946.1 DNA translocase FtsK [Lysinibacillus fusiformis]